MNQANSAKEAVCLLMQAYESLDIEGVLYYLTDDVLWIGTAWHEHRFGKKQVGVLLEEDFTNNPTPYVVKILDLRESSARLGTASIFALIEFSKAGYIDMSIKSRNTYHCVDTEDGYKICSWHCSVGTALLNEDEYFPITFANDMIQKATTDTLTNLMNRASFEEFVENHLASRLSAFAFILIDLDNFKFVNDHYGHQCGDDVLKFVAQQLRCSFGESDTVARLGGDEFVVLVPEVNSRDQVTSKVNTFIKNISQTIYLCSQPYTASASVGIFIREEGRCVSYKHCYKAADAAMYQAKNSGKSTWKII